MTEADPFADLLAANRAWADDARHDELGGVARRGVAIVTCMDSRIDPLRMVGLERGDAKIIRNAGARVTDDVLRTLVLATRLLGVDRVLVVAHTDCRMASSTDAQLHDLMRREHGIDTRSLDFRMIDDQQATLRADVQRIRSFPYLPAGLTVGGFVYDVRSCRLDEVAG